MRARLTPDIRRQIVDSYLQHPDATMWDIANLYHVHAQTVWNCLQQAGASRRRAKFDPAAAAQQIEDARAQHDWVEVVRPALQAAGYTEDEAESLKCGGIVQLPDGRPDLRPLPPPGSPSIATWNPYGIRK